MERVEEERRCLEGLLRRGRGLGSGGRDKTERKWSHHHTTSSGLYCEQLKDYIDSLQTDKQQLQTSLLLLSGKYETKADECRLATMLIEHLMEALTLREGRREWQEWREGHPHKQLPEWETSLSEMVRILEKTEGSSAATLTKNCTLIDEDFQRYRYQND